jgi:hypothetical protein
MQKIMAIGILSLIAVTGVQLAFGQESSEHRMLTMDPAKSKVWLSRWETNIINENPIRYCVAATGEAIGWKITPFLRGFYHGYVATQSTRWVDMLVRCVDAWIERAVLEPDGFLGWPAVGAAGTNIDKLDEFYADSLLGEAMVLTPIVSMTIEIRKNHALSEIYGAKADEYLSLSQSVFEKWDTRGAWRETQNGGNVTIELPFGINQKTGSWTGEYEHRKAFGIGFSHPDNKANLIANWLLAMFDATGKSVYKERAEKWFKVMKSRMRLKSDGTYDIWSYWQPAGSWDINGLPKHWVGIHPNAGYYNIDVEAIVAAYEHSVVFHRDDINHLIATALSKKRYWTALVPYDEYIQLQFESNQDPNSWDGLQRIPWYLAIQVTQGGLNQQVR